MELDALIAALSRPEPYGAPVDQAVTVIHTHISVVFLVGAEVFKIHKPVDLGFLDFTTLEQRRRDCAAEVEVNGELAPGVYRGVVAIVADRDGLEVRRSGELAADDTLVEWAVWMRRLPDSATFAALLARGELAREHLDELATILTAFYRHGAIRAAAHPEHRRHGSLATVLGNARENFTQLAALNESAAATGRPLPVPAELLEQLRLATQAELARIEARIEARHAGGAIRDTHGDLRLDHVYRLGSRELDDPVDPELTRDGPALLLIDRIEFADRFRWADPMADVAFLIMDLEARGAWTLARQFRAAFLRTSNDHEGAELLPFYVGYRATVRAKVAAMQAAEPEVPAAARARAQARAEARARLALGQLHAPDQRACLMLIGGLPGTGKSRLAAGLHERAGLHWLRADAVRKQLAGLDPLRPAGAADRQGIYTPAWTERTYAACLERAGELCRAGERVVIDASYQSDAHRRAAFAAAVDWGVPALLIVVEAAPQVVRERLAARRDDPSDADWTIYEAARARWDAVGDDLEAVTLDASGTPEQVLDAALRALGQAGLA